MYGGDVIGIGSWSLAPVAEVDAATADGASGSAGISSAPAAIGAKRLAYACLTESRLIDVVPGGRAAASASSPFTSCHAVMLAGTCSQSMRKAPEPVFS